MTNEDHRILVRQIHILYKLGLKVETEHNKLRQLVNNGVSQDDPDMIKALESYKNADAERKQLEAEHSLLRKRLGKP